MRQCRLKVYTAQLLRGAFDTLMTVVREEAVAGLHICSLLPETFDHFFRLASWFLQYCRYQEERRASKASACAPCSLCQPLLQCILLVVAPAH